MHTVSKLKKKLLIFSGGGILHDVGLNSNVPIKTNVEEVADPASLDPGKPSDAGEVLDQGLSLENLASISEFHDIAQNLDSGLLDNLLGIVAQILLPFLGTLQELLDNLTGALIGGLIASLKTLLEQLISSSVSI